MAGDDRAMTARPTFAELLASFRSSAPSAPAVITTSPAAVVTYRALAEQIERLSGELRNAGLKPGDRVAIVLPNGLELLVTFLALTCARLTAVLLYPAYKRDELGFFITDAAASAVVAEKANTAVLEA